MFIKEVKDEPIKEKDANLLLLFWLQTLHQKDGIKYIQIR